MRLGAYPRTLVVVCDQVSQSCSNKVKHGSEAACAVRITTGGILKASLKVLIKLRETGESR